MEYLEKMLWLELEESETRVSQLCSLARDKVVRLLQGRTVRGREASEVGVPAERSF